MSRGLFGVSGNWYMFSRCLSVVGSAACALVMGSR